MSPRRQPKSTTSPATQSTVPAMSRPMTDGNKLVLRVQWIIDKGKGRQVGKGDGMTTWVSEMLGQRIHALTGGEGTTVVLIPGWPETARHTATYSPCLPGVTISFAWIRRDWGIRRHLKPDTTLERSVEFLEEIAAVPVGRCNPSCWP